MRKNGQISLEITQKCMNRCIFCSSMSDKKSSLQMQKLHIYRIIREMKEMGMHLLTLSGGEPFLHPDLTEAVCHAKNEGLTVYIYTSGVTADTCGHPCPISIDMFSQLAGYGTDRIIFNLPSVSDNYDVLTGTTGHLPIVKQSIASAAESGIQTEIHFVPSRLNAGEIKQILAFAEQAGVSRVNFLGLVPHGRAEENKNRLCFTQKEKEEIKQMLSLLPKETARTGIPLQKDTYRAECSCGTRKLLVKFDGSVYGCEAFKYWKLYDKNGAEMLPDSIYEHSLAWIYGCSPYLKACRDFAESYAHTSDEPCPVQAALWKEDGGIS